MSRNKKTGTIGIVITVIILIILVVSTNGSLEKVNYAEAIVLKTVTPIKNALTYLKNKIEGNAEFFATVDELNTANEELKSKNKELEQKISELEIIKAENNTLKEYLKITESFPEYQIVPGTIINKDITNTTKIITINIGQKDGIEKNMVAVSAEGLIGHVISVSESSSKVQLIIDPGNTVSALISNNREPVVCRGILEGKSNLKAIYISTDSNISTGDKVETSGMGEIYQKGIPIGKIIEVVQTKNIIDRYAVIETYVDFSKIEYVGILKTSD